MIDSSMRCYGSSSSRCIAGALVCRPTMTKSGSARHSQMIDLASEQRIGLHEAAKLYPSFRNGRPTHISTPLRHITKGTKLPSGEIVRLEGARLGGRWITSIEAVQRFMERLTAGA